MLKRLPRSVVLTLVLALFGSLIWLGIYAYREGFSKKWRKLITKEFAKHDLIVKFDTLTIDPFQGLVANDVSLLEDKSGKEVAHISHIRLDLDLPRLIRGEEFLERIELESADLSLPYDRPNPESERLDLNKLSATIILSEDSFDIVEATTSFYGVNIRLTGQLGRASKTPDQDKMGLLSWKPEKLKDARPVLAKIIEQLKQLRYAEETPPMLDLELTGDLEDSATLLLNASLSTQAVRLGEFLLDETNAQAVLAPDKLEITRFEAKRADRRLHATAEIPLADRDTQPAKLAAESTLSLHEFFKAVYPEHEVWNWLTLTTSPQINFEAEILLDQPFTIDEPPVDLIGEFVSGPLLVKGQRFENLEGQFHVKGQQVLFRDLTLRHATGSSKGKFIHQPQEGIRYEADIGMDPTALSEMPLPEEARAFLNRWQFGATSTIALHIEGERKSNETASWEHKGTLHVKNCGFETAALEHATLTFNVNPHSYHFDNIFMQVQPDHTRNYSGGSLEAKSISINGRTGVTILGSVIGQIDPAQIVRCFNPTIAGYLDRYRFSQPPEIKIIQGTIDPRSTSEAEADGMTNETNFTVQVKAPDLLRTQVLGKDLPFEKPRFGLVFQRNALTVTSYHAGLFGGEIEGNVLIKDLDTARNYYAKLVAKNVDFDNVAALYFPETKTKGDFSGNFTWRGRGSDLKSVEGEGTAHLLNGRTLEVPVLGPLSILLETVIGKNKITHELIHDLGMRYKLAQGRLDFEEITAHLDAYELSGKGWVDLVTDAIDFEVALTNETAAGVLLNVIYQVFGTYRCQGTLKNPKWKLAHRLSSEEAKDIARKIREKSGDLDPKELLKLDPTGILKSLLDGAR